MTTVQAVSPDMWRQSPEAGATSIPLTAYWVLLAPPMSSVQSITILDTPQNMVMSLWAWVPLMWAFALESVTVSG